jgi:hypothetical protein
MLGDNPYLSAAPVNGCGVLPGMRPLALAAAVPFAVLLALPSTMKKFPATGALSFILVMKALMSNPSGGVLELGG